MTTYTDQQAVDLLAAKLAAPGNKSISLARTPGGVLLKLARLGLKPPLPPPPPPPTGGDPDLTFEATFDTLDLSQWDTMSPTVWDRNANGSSLPSNNEAQWYINNRFGPTSELVPWRVENGELVLTADRCPDRLRYLLGYDPADWPDARFDKGTYAYFSGWLDTHMSFAQRYGRFELVAKLPKGRGLWPAWWFMPSDGTWPPELDALEVLGDDTTKLYSTLHAGGWPNPSAEATVPDMSLDFHRYGLEWREDFIRFSFDGQPYGEPLPTPGNFHKPMYMILNLAVGGEGSWPGPPDAATVFPAQYRVRSLRAWR